MKAQATLETLLLFVFTLIMIMTITQALLSSYKTIEEKNSAIRSRAILENELLTFSIACNRDVDLPPSIVKSVSDYSFSLERWLIIIKVRDDYGVLQETGNFSTVTLGCYLDEQKSFV